MIEKEILFPKREKIAGKEISILKVLITVISNQLEVLNSLTAWIVLMIYTG